MDNNFEKIYDWTNEKLTNEKNNLREFKIETRQIEGLIVAIIILCLIIAFFAPTIIAKYIFITVAILMFIICAFYIFKGERNIIEMQNRFSDFALSELVTHIKDGFIYERNEEISEINYKKSGFNRIYGTFESYGLISGDKNNQEISISNIIVKSEQKELFKGVFAYSTISGNFDEIDVMNTNCQNNKKEKYDITGLGLYVYAENMTDARKIITDKVIKYMEQFVNETKIRFELMINKNMIFFRFFDKNILTRPISNEKETKEFLYKYYKIIEFISNFSIFFEN